MGIKRPFGSRGYGGAEMVGRSGPKDAAGVWRLFSTKGENKELLDRLCTGPFSGTSPEIMVACGIVIYDVDCGGVLRSLDLYARGELQPQFGVRVDFYERHRREFRRVHDAPTAEEKEKVWKLAKGFVGEQRATIRWSSDVRTVGAIKEAKAKKFAIRGAYDCRVEIKAAGGQWDAQQRAWIVTDKQLEDLEKRAASKRDINFWLAWSQVRPEPLIEKKK
ncbi:MAG: hypothetical protein ACRD19_02145 [Terriglobia bacterium]